MARKDEDASSYVAVPATPKQHFLQDDAIDHHDANPKGLLRSRGHWWWPWRYHKTLSLAEAYAQQPPFRTRPNPLQNASIPSIISVNWFQPVVSLGAQKILENEDFWAVCPQDSCDVLRERFVTEYAQQQSEQKLWGGLRISVSRVGLTLLWAFRRDILVAAANFMVYLVAMSLQPFISQAILDFLNDRDNVFHLSSGYWLAVVMTGASFVGVTCLNYGVFICSRIGVNMRSMIMSVIYEKALTLSCEARQGYSTGEIMTMMSVDSDRVFNAMLNEETTEKEMMDAAATASVDGFRLEGVNLQIDAGSLVMIVGTVGSGKSSLLNALLGEMILTDGSVSVQGEVSYVSQESWIRNSSVKDNILFESKFDGDRYEKVLEATQLAMDLHALPDGDQTEIGERGINLSGGQKARVAIARAMYRSKYDILILDDPLSAVDPHVAHAIFNQCIVGLAKDKTRLLVLNSHYDLLMYADKILVVQDGHIAGDGTYSEILAQFPELRIQSAALDKLEKDVIDEHEGTHEEEHQHEAAVAVADAAKQRIESATEVSRLAEQKDGDADVAKLVQDEDRVKGKVSGSTYKSYFDETGFDGYVVVMVIFLVYAVSQSMRILVDWWQGHWAKNMPRDGVDLSYSGLWFGMWYLAFIVVCSLMTFGRGVLLLQSCMRSSKNLHDELFRRVLSAPINRYFDVTPVGRILNRFSGDLDQMDSILPQQYQNFFQTTSVFLGSLVVCAMTSFWVGLSYLPMLLIFVVTGLYFKKTSREVKRLDGISRTPVFNLFGETLNGLATIRAFKMQDKFVKLNKEAVDNNATFYLSYWAAGRWLAIRLDWLSVLIIFVVSLYLVGTKGQVDPVIAGISLTYSLMLTSMVQWVVRAADMTDNAMTSVERLLHFRNIPVEDDGANATPINSELWPSQGAIKFDQLCLKYRPELPLVLRGVNMDIQGGEKVGICGRTGAGKSSLMIALFRICEFESGSVFIDGLDIQSVKLRDLRRSLAIIPQDPVLYSGSLRENLDPFGDYADDLIWSVLKQVHLSDSVTKWGAGLDFVVSEQGDNLSVGQRQLLCIARALLKDSKIVVLDEATANVDTATDNLIQVTIRETFVAKTVLIIAHRINTIMHCDKIAVMDAGQVAEFGSPSDLLSQSDTIFASLAKRSAQA
uniref:Uncharacterized protein n=1 Tax=Globisporangium ultimum (strain ATCC 200006 / CBS 805.95 / DAOM BR144) TaxID=431595 RepID=K3X2G2_GLOUD